MLHLATPELYLTADQSVPRYHIPAFETYPQLTQAIFTRNGGVSQHPYHSLNLGSLVGDEPAAVRQNLQLVYQAVDVTPAQVVTCHLVHGAKVLTVTQTNLQPMMGQADGLVSREAGVHLIMCYADCTPLIFFDPQQSVIGLAHAGWRSTMQNIAGAMVEAMQRLGCQPGNIIAVIGPAIGPCCYEIGPEVVTEVQQNFTEADYLLSHANPATGQAHFDLWAANRHQLIAQGINQIIETNLCTACHTDIFFSHRAEGGWTGRFGVIIGLKDKVT